MPPTRIPNLATPCDTAFICDLDPLDADGVVGRIPELNAAADVSAMTAMLRDLLPRPGLIAAFSLPECLAAMRDLGPLLGSVKRHGHQPVDLVPEAEPVLVELGARTGMIPRDTVHHYTEWNPTGPRQRMYTGEPMETYLMNGARMSLPHLGAAVEICRDLVGGDPADSAFTELIVSLRERIQSFDAAISMVVEKVTPEFFAHRMRPFYEEVRVDGVTYLGPAAAHVPLFLVDLAVWASDRCEKDYDAFIDEASMHTLPQWRATVPTWRAAPSLVTRIVTALEAGQPVEASARALGDVLRTLVVFRGKHLAIARKAYRDEVKLYDIGSGGGSIALLHEILDLTRRNAGLVRAPRSEAAS